MMLVSHDDASGRRMLPWGVVELAGGPERAPSLLLVVGAVGFLKG